MPNYSIATVENLHGERCVGNDKVQTVQKKTSGFQMLISEVMFLFFHCIHPKGSLLVSSYTGEF